MNRRICLLLLFAVLGACSGLPQLGPQPALYDFGIVSADRQAVPVKLGQIEAAPGLDGHEMHYRLAYQNPSRVFAFSESRWAVLPADLVAQRIQGLWAPGSDTHCRLNITLDTFDQVFDTPQASRGVVQLRAELVTGNGRDATHASTVVKVEKPSASADAKGGVAALTAATDDALAQLKGWVGAQQCSSANK